MKLIMSLAMGFWNLSIYENALYIVLTGHGLCVERQKDISVFFRGIVIGDFKADLIKFWQKTGIQKICI